MTLLSRLVGRMVDLPPAETHDVTAERVATPTGDGVVLAGTHYAPAVLDDRPTVLVRSPYPRTGFGLFGRVIAERGFHVLFQSCRGTFGSGGSFDPFRDELADARATVAWLCERSWFDGRLATTGASYLGYAQWALARALRDVDADVSLQAMVPQATTADPRNMIFPQRALGLDSLSWAATMAAPDGSLPRFLARELGVGIDTEAATRHLPLRTADRVAVGEQIPFWREWLDNARDAEWWERTDHREAVADVDAPVHLVGGWQDLFCPAVIREYRSLVDAGRDPYLTVGPWAHDDGGLQVRGLRESIRWLRAHALDARATPEDRELRTDPVEFYVQGADEWRTDVAWPPSAVAERRWYLTADRALAIEPPSTSFVERFRYDPRDPTPSVGGPVLGGDAGRTEQTSLESRPDVVTYTSAPLTAPIEVFGRVSADLVVDPKPARFDVYACLCAVDSDGVSRNVCDGLVRHRPTDAECRDGPRRVTVECRPTAFRFEPGSRIRIQIAGGAFPRWSRNPGTSAPIGEATTLHPVDHAVHGGPDDRSWISLPVDGAET